MILSVVLDSRRTCKKTSVELLLHNKALQHQVASNNNEKKKAKKNIIVAHSLETVQFGPPTAEWFFQPGPDSVNIGWALLYLGSAAELPGSWLVPHRLAEMAYLCSMWCLFLQQANLSLMGWWQQPRSQEQQEEKPQCTGTFQVKSRHVAMPTVVQEGIIKCLDTGGRSKCGRHHHQSTPIAKDRCLGTRAQNRCLTNFPALTSKPPPIVIQSGGQQHWLAFFGIYWKPSLGGNDRFIAPVAGLAELWRHRVVSI